MTEVRKHPHSRGFWRLSMRAAVSRLYAHSKNYDMDLTLDYNVELYPLQADQSFALALASSLARGPNAAGDEDEKDRDIWRPDGKGRRGLEEDYEYVMYGKVRRAAVRGARGSVDTGVARFTASTGEHQTRCECSACACGADGCSRWE